MLPDLLQPGLTVVFVGTSVSETSAREGHYYARASNKFWELLTATGLTDGKRLRPVDDARLPQMGVGLTDLVKGRAASSDARLKHGDFDVPGFLAKIRTHRPKVIAFNGEKACSHVAKHLGERTPLTGPAPWLAHGARVYRLPSSSGAAAMGTAVKTVAWAEFGEWVRSGT